MADREENNEPEQEQATSEGQGEDIGPYRRKGPDDDSNEEDEDDPEEVRWSEPSDLAAKEDARKKVERRESQPSGLGRSTGL
jgi:hypothetical protein